MSELKLHQVVVGVASLGEAARVFADNLELPGARDGDAHRIPIGAASIALSEGEDGSGLRRLVLCGADTARMAERLREAGVPFEERDGALILDGTSSHGVPLEITS